MNKFIEAVDKAYKNKELVKLLGCNENYIFDSSHKYCLSEDFRLTGRSQDECDPINFYAILSAAEEYYCSLNKASGEKKKFFEELCGSIEALLATDDAEQVYFAVKIYFILGERNVEDIFYPFKGLYSSVKQNVIKSLIRCNEGLKASRKYEGKITENGLWGVIVALNDNANSEVKLEGIS